MFSFITVVVFYVVLGWVGYAAIGKEVIQRGYGTLNKGMRLPQPLKYVVILLALSLILIIVGVVGSFQYVIEKVKQLGSWLRKVTVKA